LLEVVSQNLLELEGPLAGGGLEPVGVAFMQVGPRELRHGLVGGVPDQLVAEAVRIRTLTRDELLACERRQQASNVLLIVLDKGRDALAGEIPTGDRRSLEDPPLVDREQIEAGREQGVDRRRHADAN